MLRFVFLITLLTCFSPVLLQADLDIEPTVLSYRVIPENQAQMNAIALKFEVVRETNNAYEVYVPFDEREEFFDLAPDAELLSEDIRIELFDSINSAELLASYHSLDEVYEYLQNVQNNYPEITKIIQYGTSKQGRPLYALKISDNVQTDESDEPDLLITSATHGDEIITVEVVLSAINQLLEAFPGSPLSQLINSNEIYFIPIVNPDGFSRRSRYSNGVDPNRAYPLVTGGQNHSINCIEHLISFFHTKNFVRSMDIHAYGQLVMHPWAYTRESTQDDSKFNSLGQKMASHNNYRHGQVSKILYPAPGSSADYYYWKNKTLAFGVEVAKSKAPRASDIPRVLANTEKMIWKFIEGDFESQNNQFGFTDAPH